jgi:hypothetical protein
MLSFIINNEKFIKSSQNLNLFQDTLGQSFHKNFIERFTKLNNDPYLVRVLHICPKFFTHFFLLYVLFSCS